MSVVCFIGKLSAGFGGPFGYKGEPARGSCREMPARGPEQPLRLWRSISPCRGKLRGDVIWHTREGRGGLRRYWCDCGCRCCFSCCCLRPLSGLKSRMPVWAWRPDRDGITTPGAKFRVRLGVRVWPIRVVFNFTSPWYWHRPASRRGSRPHGDWVGLGVPPATRRPRGLASRLESLPTRILPWPWLW